MISFDNSTPTGVLMQPAVGSGQNSAKASTDADSGASFSDVMQQQEESSTPAHSPTAPATSAPAAKPFSPTNSPITDREATETVPPEAPTATPSAAKLPATPLAPGSDLSAMIVQAAVLASNAQSTLPVQGVNTVMSTATPTTGKGSTPQADDLSALIAQATILLSGGKESVVGTGASTTTSSSANKSASNSASGTPASKTSTPGTSNSIDLSTLIAQTSNLAQSVSAISGATSGKNLPVSGPGTATVGAAAKEKKSPSASAGGSFLQSGSAASSTGSNSFDPLKELQAVTSGALVSQQFASNAGTKNSAVESVATAAPAIAGTANVEKGKAMSTELNFPELELLSGTGTNAVPSPNGADMHIQLASNSDFTDALQQVMHVAQLAEANGSRAPMRVEMEIQTPPGAIVNVYVSKQSDGWRAQLSTNDPAALSWVQQQVTSLKQSSDLGVEVKWLPPQLEGTATIATSSGQESNLSWNQGGQGQAHDQQPDERQQSGRQQNADATPEFADLPSGQFMQTLNALGRAA